MVKRVYITGIAGLIGSNLAKYYLKKGWIVRGCDNLIGGYETNVPKAAVWSKIDICDTEALDNALNPGWGSRYDVIIHCAALAYEGLSVFSPSLITDNIYGGTVAVASSAIEAGIPLFINCSSMARYGNLLPPFRETMECKPVDPYGLAKLHAEQQLELLSEIYPEFKYYTVVPHNVSGAQQVYTDPYRNVLSIMIHQALAKRPIYIYGDGQQKRSFSHVDDCVKAIDAIITNLPEEKVFNIGPDHNEITIAELAELVKKYTNSNVPVQFLDPRPREVKNAWCSSDRAAEVLNYEAVKPLSTIIEEIKDYIFLNGVGEFKYNLPIQITKKPIPPTWSKEKLFNKTIKEVNLANAN